jgi:hypothetical protein
MRNRVSMMALFAVSLAAACGYDPHPKNGGVSPDGGGSGDSSVPDASSTGYEAGASEAGSLGEAGGVTGIDGGGVTGIDGPIPTGSVEAGGEASGPYDLALDKPDDVPSAMIDGSKDTNSGGNAGTGGAGGAGGVIGTGEIGDAGGASGADAPIATGGITGSGGGSATDAPLTTGGAGGATTTGGIGGSTTSTGGRVGTGGALGAGGAISVGGTPGTGGAYSSGGTPGTGGATQTGGTTGTGGMTGTGGNTGTGGSTQPTGCQPACGICQVCTNNSCVTAPDNNECNYADGSHYGCTSNGASIVVDVCVSGSCVVGGGVGGTCSSATYCSAYNYIATCVSKAPSGDHGCSSNFECLSNSCIGGICQ